MNSLISEKQFHDSEQVTDFLINAEYKKYSHSGKIMASLFFEPSTRTRFSFESAMLRLKGSVITESNFNNLSVAKGESLEDTIRTISEYADIIVLRHPEKTALERAVKVSKVPIINAGCHSDSHPTQGLLDVFTIRQKFKKIKDLSVLMCGDLLNSRTIHSLIYLLKLYPNIRLYGASPRELVLPDKIFDCGSLKDGLKEKPDVIYMTRFQKERCNFNVEWNNYCLTPELMKLVKEDAIIMHPLPRNEEIPTEIDIDPRCIYFTNQVRNGLIVRMAILDAIFNKSKYWENYV